MNAREDERTQTVVRHEQPARTFGKRARASFRRRPTPSCFQAHIQVLVGGQQVVSEVSVGERPTDLTVEEDERKIGEERNHQWGRRVVAL